MGRMDRLEEGLFVEYSGKYTAVATEGMSYETYDTVYTLSYHEDDLPAFNVDSFDNLDDMKAAMRKIAPLRNWRVVKHN